MSALNPQEVGQLLIVDCGSDVPTTENMIVGESLILRCSVNTMTPVNDFQFIWRSNNTIVRMTEQTEQIHDYYVISQLNTSNDHQVYQCEVIINTNVTEAENTSGIITLYLNGKSSTNLLHTCMGIHM